MTGKACVKCWLLRKVSSGLPSHKCKSYFPPRRLKERKEWSPPDDSCHHVPFSERNVDTTYLFLVDPIHWKHMFHENGEGLPIQFMGSTSFSSYTNSIIKICLNNILVDLYHFSKLLSTSSSHSSAIKSSTSFINNVINDVFNLSYISYCL
ncbi:hypothetical protein CR513_01242, partial [Mucuna pruriens]